MVFTVPNLISIARLVAIPFVVLAMLKGAWLTAFALFLAAGASDAVDGYIARHFGQRSLLGTYLDPLADKALTIAVFTTFAARDVVPVWLLALVVARDVAIVAGAAILHARGNSSAIRPLMISKLNTVVLIVMAGWLLASHAFDWSFPAVEKGLITTVALLTAVSAVAYGRLLMRTLGAAQQKDGVQ